MWLAILAIIDKILGMFSNLVPFWINRSDASKKARDAAQVEMQAAVQKGDLNAYWDARSRRNRA